MDEEPPPSRATRPPWLSVAVPAVASLVATLLGVLVGGLVTAHIENNQNRHEVRASFVAKRSEVYMEFVESLNDVLSEGAYTPDGAPTPWEELPRARGRALRRMVDAKTAVDIFGSDRVSRLGGDCVDTAHKYADAAARITDATKIAEADPAREAAIGNNVRLIMTMRFELRALGGLDLLDVPVPGLPNLSP